jgi:paraquat-inducible protein B
VLGKKANSAAIGGFVVGAAALLVVGVLVFSGGQLWAEKVHWVSYFPGSARGLQIGAPVTFRGVKIGQVTDIGVVFDPTNNSTRIPVHWEFERNRIQMIGMSDAELRETQEAGGEKDRRLAAILIKRGLRATLEMQSFVTGQQYIQLDFYPDSPPQLENIGSDVPEFPTTESGISQLTKRIDDLRLEEIADKALLLLQHVDELVTAPETAELIRSSNRTLVQYSELARRINDEILPQSLQVIARIDTQLTPAASEALVEASALMKQGSATLESYETLIGERSPMRYEVSSTLGELKSAARSLRVLADYLEQHPEALLKGKGGPGREEK